MKNSLIDLTISVDLTKSRNYGVMIPGSVVRSGSITKLSGHLPDFSPVRKSRL